MTARHILPALVVLLAAACSREPPAELDLTPYRGRVCDLLTLAQLSGFGVDQPGKPAEDSDSCLWESPGTKILVRLEDYTDPTFAEDAGTVNGFPAHHWGIPGKGARLACATTVDTRRRQTFTAIVYTEPNACPASDTVASLVVDTVRGGR